MAIRCIRATSGMLVRASIAAACCLACHAGRQESQPNAPTPPPPAAASAELPQTKDTTESDQHGEYGQGKPSPFAGQKVAPAPKQRNQGGPSQRTEKAVLEGLRWLARHQNDDGSWGAISFRSHCPADAPCCAPDPAATDQYDVGLTGLALLCFLDEGFGPESKLDLVDTVNSKRHKTGIIVKNGLEWLRRHQRPDGSFGSARPFMYNQAIATSAMAEASHVSRKSDWDEAARLGVACLQEAQRPSPSGSGLWGWRYESLKDVRGSSSSERFDADTSVTAWCAFALARAQRAGVPVTQDSLDGAMAFCRFVTAKNGLVGYIDPKSAGATVSGPFDDKFVYHPATMSALGAWIHVFAMHDAEDPWLALAQKRIVQDLPTVSEDHSSIDYYYWHAATLALIELDGPDSPGRTGKYWNAWNKALIDALLPLQHGNDQTCQRGGWIADDRWGSWSRAGPLYSTALNVLTLELPYAAPDVFALTVEIGFAAPDFQVMDDLGSPFSLSACRGSVVLLDFRSTLFDWVKSYVDSRRDLAEELSGKPFTILSLGVRGADDAPLPSPELRGIASWRSTPLLERSDPILQKYGWHGGRPSTIVIDAAGMVRGVDLPWDVTMQLARELIVEAKRQPK